MAQDPTRRWFLSLASAVVAAVAMAGVGPQPAAAAGQIEEIKWALPSVPDTLFIPHAWSTYIGAIMSLVQEGPLAFGDDLSLAPAVADSWQRSIRRR